jgi:hypothetical protein
MGLPFARTIWLITAIRHLLESMEMTKTLYLFIGTLVFCLSACAGRYEDKSLEKPNIVEVFACSDYCPGPEKKYLKKVYEGVNDEATCLKFGGKPYRYLGWGNYFVCIAK